MHPEFISYPHISSYPVLMLAGFFFGYLMARWRASTLKFAGRHIDNITLILLVMGPLGARIFSRLFYLPDATLWSALKFWEEGGGLVFYGGFIFGVGTVALYSLVHRLSVIDVVDIFSPSAALGLAFGRIGCFMAGCCFGDLCVEPSKLSGANDPFERRQVQTVPMVSGSTFPLSVSFPAKSEAYGQHQRIGLLSAEATRSLPVHPTQLYEAAAAFALCLWLNLCFKTRKFPGEVFCALGIGYACVRFPLEFLRADSPPIYLGMTFSQVTSLMIALACVLLRINLRRGLSRSLQPQVASKLELAT
jgi:phosphatidylglycerol:prolipoprotein diacylglycerol transferase